MVVLGRVHDNSNCIKEMGLETEMEMEMEMEHTKAPEH